MVVEEEEEEVLVVEEAVVEEEGVGVAQKWSSRTSYALLLRPLVWRMGGRFGLVEGAIVREFDDAMA